MTNYFIKFRPGYRSKSGSNCSIQTTFSVLRLYRETNNIIQREGRGRLNASNDDQIRVLRQLLYRYPNMTSSNMNSRFY